MYSGSILHRRGKLRSHLKACAFFRAIRGLAREERGAAAVEFGLISIPFFATIFFLAESGYNFFIQSQLEKATEIVSRQIMVGAAQNAGLGVADIRNEICNRLSVGNGCADRLYVDVRSYNPASGGHLDPASLDRVENQYCLGGPGQFTLIKVAYTAPVITSIWQASQVYVDGESVRALRVGMVFRNEPFAGTPGATC